MEDSAAFPQDEMSWDIAGLFRGAIRLVLECVLQEEVPLAKAAAQKALDVDPELSEAHTPLAYALLAIRLGLGGCAPDVREGRRGEPRLYRAHQRWTALGRTAESLAESEKALDLDPLDPVLKVHMVWHHHQAREYERAREHGVELMELGARPLPRDLVPRLGARAAKSASTRRSQCFAVALA